MSTLTDVKQLHEKLDSFYASGYLATWCEGSVRAEWAEFLHQVFSDDVGEAPMVLDVGCGPSICNVISGTVTAFILGLREFIPVARCRASRDHAT